MRNKIMPFSRLQDNISPWHLHDEPDLFGLHAFRTNDPERNHPQKRNYSQPISRHRSNGKQFTVGRIDPLLFGHRDNNRNLDSETKRIKKTGHLFTKTMNIIFKASDQPNIQCSANGSKEGEPYQSQRSIGSTPTNFRIHSNNPGALIFAEYAHTPKSQRERKDIIQRKMVVTSYNNFFASSIKRHNTAKNLNQHNARVDDILKILRNSSKKKVQRQKLMKKIERNNLKKYIQASKCLY